MVIAQGDVWWADLPEPAGSAAGYRRPVLVIQGPALNRSRRNTVVCVPLTSSLRQAEDPCHVLLTAEDTGLERDSVAITSQILTVDRAELTDRVGRLEVDRLAAVLRGIDRVLGR